MVQKFLLIAWHDLTQGDDPLRVFKKSYARYRKHGLQRMYEKLQSEYTQIQAHRNPHKESHKAYQKWIEQYEDSTATELALLDYTPTISIIMPTYNTPKRYLEEAIGSVLAQSYTHWELCIADDASSDPEIHNTLQTIEQKDPRIKVTYRDHNGHISEASNSALALATGEYVAFLDHDDMLSPHALYEMAKKLNANPALKFLYSDEDKIDEAGNRYAPHFKSGWNYEMFLSHNYICHFTMIQRELIAKVGGFRKGYEGSQDYDLFLRVIKHLDSDEIDRVDKILYHWRAIKGSTALADSEKSYAHEAGKKALQEYIESQGIQANVQDGLLPNTYKVTYTLTEKPLVSLLIPTRDGYEMLHKCIESILEKTTYPNYEIIILDNETTCPKTLQYFEKISQYPQVTILEYHYPFNYAAINNFGVRHTKGEIIGLINNDIEIISTGWLEEMVSYAVQKGVGAVGAKLYYDNETIQHAGVVLGIGGVAGHSHKHFQKDANGYFSRLKIVQNYAAVTGACLLVRKSLYEEVGGLDEVHLKVAFNDVDFCLKLLEKGYRNVWTPYAQAYHHESVSRGAEDTPEKVKRFNAEVSYMKQRWSDMLEADLMYNSNLTKKHENFGLNIDA